MMTNRQSHFIENCTARTALALLVLWTGALATAAEAPRAESLLPKNTTLAVIVPELKLLRQAGGKFALAEIYAQAEMQQFLQPAWRELETLYNDLRTRHPKLPELAKWIEQGLDGELVIGLYERKAAQPGLLISAPLGLVRPVLEATGVEVVEGGEMPLTAELSIMFSGSRALIGVLGDLQRFVAEAKRNPASALAGVPGYALARAGFKNSPLLMFVAAGSPGHEAYRRWAAVLNQQQVIGSLFGLDLTRPGGTLFSTSVFEDAAARDKFVASLAQLPTLSPEALKVAAIDAPYVAAATPQTEHLLPALRALAGMFNPRGEAIFDQGQQQINAALQLDLEQDFFGNLGHNLVLAQTATDTGPALGIIPGMVLSIDVKDAQKMQAVLKKFALLKLPLPAQTAVPALSVKQSTYDQSVIYHVSSPVIGWPIAFTQIQQRLLIGTSVNAVRRTLDQLKKNEDILANKSFQETMARLLGHPLDPQHLPRGLSYASGGGASGNALLTASTAILAGGLALLGLEQLLDAGDAQQRQPLDRTASLLLRLGGAVNLSLWPDEGFFENYRRPLGAVRMLDEQGLSAQVDWPLPLPQFNVGNSATILAVTAAGAGLALPVLSRARGAAKRANSAANLKRLSTACMLYAMDHGEGFPTTPAQLQPDYLNDPRPFHLSSTPGEAGYVYVAGSTVQDAQNVLAYEQVAEQPVGPGRNVAYVNGSVEFVDERSFKEKLSATEEQIKAAGRTMKLLPIDLKPLAPQTEPDRRGEQAPAPRKKDVPEEF